MFEDKILWAMQTKGLGVKEFDSLLRDELYLSDNKIFAISRFLNEVKPSIFLTKNVGNLKIIGRRFDVAVTYTVQTKNQCRISVDFNTLSLEVEYVDCTLVIDQNLSDYRGEHTKLNDARQYFLNEVMIRYFAQVLYATYMELRWYL